MLAVDVRSISFEQIYAMRLAALNAAFLENATDDNLELFHYHDVKLVVQTGAGALFRIAHLGVGYGVIELLDTFHRKSGLSDAGRGCSYHTRNMMFSRKLIFYIYIAICSQKNFCR